ncbi:MAG: hypothetical protein Q7K42_02765, partial [Candidatus Diapherotrites archaeon]|nr:hypothetical protein [Candidatus Diapherotrites archaeon]
TSLVVVLVIGVILIDFFKPKKNSQLHAMNMDTGLYAELTSAQSKIKAADELIKMAHSRISDLELLVQSSDKINNGKEIAHKVAEINSKLYELERYQSNSKVDLVAIKEIALEMRDFLDEQKSKDYLNELTKQSEKASGSNYNSPQQGRYR